LEVEIGPFVKNLNDSLILRHSKIKFEQAILVKIAKTKFVFEKGYTSNYSKETFIIRAISKSRPVPMYRLTDELSNDLEGKLQEPELIKV
jgi:hypothetical protein